MNAGTYLFLSAGYNSMQETCFCQSAYYFNYIKD